MPTYEYACTACDERLEVVQKFTDAALTECPECGGALRKVFSAVGVVFKGSGFYKTDSRNGSKHGSSSKTESTSEKTTASSTSASTSTTSTPAAASTSSSSSTPASAAAAP